MERERECSERRRSLALSSSPLGLSGDSGLGESSADDLERTLERSLSRSRSGSCRTRRSLRSPADSRRHTTLFLSDTLGGEVQDSVRSPPHTDTHTFEGSIANHHTQSSCAMLTQQTGNTSMQHVLSATRSLDSHSTPRTDVIATGTTLTHSCETRVQHTSNTHHSTGSQHTENSETQSMPRTDNTHRQHGQSAVGQSLVISMTSTTRIKISNSPSRRQGPVSSPEDTSVNLSHNPVGQSVNHSGLAGPTVSNSPSHLSALPCPQVNRPVQELSNSMSPHAMEVPDCLSSEASCKVTVPRPESIRLPVRSPEREPLTSVPSKITAVAPSSPDRPCPVTSPSRESRLASTPSRPRPALAEEAERAYPRVGETVECHLLVRGLRSYETLANPLPVPSPSPSPTSPLPRPAPAHCSKWKKEREAEERDGALSPSSSSASSIAHTRDELHGGKMAARGAKRGSLTLRSGAPNSSATPRVRSKPAAAPSDSPASARASRIAPPRTSSLRSSPITRPTAAPTQIRRHGSVKETAATAGQLIHRATDRTLDREATTSQREKQPTVVLNREPFVRGSPLRVSKRVAPHSEASVATQMRGGAHSPSSSSSTPKSIRTAVISGARAKNTKTDTSMPKAPATVGTRIPGPKIARATSQPTWK